MADTQDEVVRAHGGLRRRGSEWRGDCPLPDCAASDSFYVVKEGRFYCRACLPSGKNTKRYLAMRRRLGLRIEGNRDRARRGGIRSGQVRRQKVAALDAQIVGLRRQGWSWRKIAKACGCSIGKARHVVRREDG